MRSADGADDVFRYLLLKRLLEAAAQGSTLWSEVLELHHRLLQEADVKTDVPWLDPDDRNAAESRRVARAALERFDAVKPNLKDAAELIAAPAVHEAFAAMARCTLALVGMGALDETLSLLQQGVVTAAELEHMRARGAIGMICGRAFDSEGRHVPSDFDTRLLSASIPLLRTVPIRLAVAFGERKAPGIRALLKSGLINGIGTDAETARLILD